MLCLLRTLPQIPSDQGISFDKAPAMKAKEIAGEGKWGSRWGWLGVRVWVAGWAAWWRISGSEAR